MPRRARSALDSSEIASSTMRRRSNDGSAGLGMPVPVLAYFNSVWNIRAGLCSGGFGALAPLNETFSPMAMPPFDLVRPTCSPSLYRVVWLVMAPTA